MMKARAGKSSGSGKLSPKKLPTLINKGQNCFLAEDKASLFAKKLKEKFLEHPANPSYSCQDYV